MTSQPRQPYTRAGTRGQVRMYVEEQDDVPWDTLNVIVADVTYGGRVTDVWDKRTIASIMRLYFDPGLLDDSYRFRQALPGFPQARRIPKYSVVSPVRVSIPRMVDSQRPTTSRVFSQQTASPEISLDVHPKGSGKGKVLPRTERPISTTIGMPAGPLSPSRPGLEDSVRTDRLTDTRGAAFAARPHESPYRATLGAVRQAPAHRASNSHHAHTHLLA